MKNKLNVKYGEWILFCIFFGEVYSLVQIKKSLITFIISFLSLSLTAATGGLSKEVGFMRQFQGFAPYSMSSFIIMILSYYVIVPSLLYLLVKFLKKMNSNHDKK